MTVGGTTAPLPAPPDGRPIEKYEDEDMMRPFVVHPPEVAKFHLHPGNGHHEH
ncbi:hypothetical protein [Amycolatopsis acidicola]|uniref:hypothetical protein n=1 Tax=Amycolatopsis acidicola TaxID=2596893 RepID=UPI001409C5CE|nr:hypothetical protein [Amycolatopsis acidicola]